MALNSGIILAGVAPDVVGSMARGTEAGLGAARAGRENALARLYQTQGDRVLAGDREALNALARLSPDAAMGVQNNMLGMEQTRLGMDATRLGMDQTRQNMAFNREEMEMRRAAAAEAARAAAAQMTAEQRAAAAAEIENGLKGAAPYFQSGDKAGYDRWLSSQGIDPAQYPFEQFPSHAAQLTGVLDTLKSFQDMAPKEVTGSDRFKVVGSQLIDLMGEGGPKVVAESAGQTETIYGPGGQPIITRGPSTGVKFTEAQSKDTVYATRAEGALQKLEPVVNELTSRAGKVGDALSGVTMGLSREAMQTDSYQVAKNAGDEFLQAILRKDTGAAITEQEQRLYGDTFLPRPGDGEAVLQAKREARQRALSAIQAGMNMDQIAATERALVDSARITGTAGGEAPAASSPPAGGVKRLRFNPETGDFE